MARVRQGLATLALAVLLCAIARPVAAQVNTATVFGSVKDAQGGVIPGATVTLISDTQGTKVAPTTTNETGDFVFPGIPADTYTVQVEMPSFKTLKHSGLSRQRRFPRGGRDAHDRRGRRDRDRRRSRPKRRSFRRRAASVRSSSSRPHTTTFRSSTDSGTTRRSRRSRPGVVGTSRQGSNGQNTYTMDGVLTMDTGSNGQLLQMNPESIAEVKILTSNYQAEYGRSTGVQIATVSKSGTNQFRGSVYEIYRNNQWNWENGKPGPTSEQRPDAAPSISKQHDRGYSIGGPIGKPGGQNKLFFFYSDEFRPRTAGGDIVAVPRPDTARARGRLLADARQQREPDQRHVRRVQRACRRVSASRAAPRRPASRTAACSARSRRTGCTGSG